MCRIAGIIDPSVSAMERHRRVKAMCDVQQHGGPDDEGLWADESVHFTVGHRRLSLLDLSPGGHQPMVWQNDTLVISFNGEIYNYPEVKRELEAEGYRFRSGSDTEVILGAFACWGSRSFQKLSGMFAFALYDRVAQKVFLVRDCTGIKPLYYHISGDKLVFASEVRAFHTLPDAPPAHPVWPVYFMAYGHLPEPVTTLKDVVPLPKGSFLCFDLQTGRAERESYGHFSFLEKATCRDEVVVSVRETLSRAVKRHLLSDAPIGAFLSGGIDSSLIALLSGAVLQQKLNTLSVYFDEGAYSEKTYQDRVVAQLHCHHHGYRLTQDAFANSLPSVLEAMDLPSCDGLNTWFISRAAKEQGLKAVLSGLGGDELFGGYPSFQRMRAARLLQRLPGVSLRTGKHTGLKQLRRLPYLSLPGMKGIYLFLRGQFIPSEIARHLDMEEREVWHLLDQQPILPSVQHLTYKNQASWMEMNLYMQNQLLRDSDVMSMAHGIEIRVPFLDPEVVRLALQISTEIKYAGGGKQLLIDAFRDMLPEAVYNRPKMGFAFPFREWLQENEFVRDQMADTGAAARKTYSQFLDGKRHWSQLFTLFLARQSKHEAANPFSYA